MKPWAAIVVFLCAVAIVVVCVIVQRDYANRRSDCDARDGILIRRHCVERA